MGMEYKCPACQNAVDRAATVCSNPSCRAELAFCSHCRAVTTYTLVERNEGPLGRDKFKCSRCERLGVKCLTWAAGGDCNGLARVTGGRFDKALCAGCSTRVGEVSRSVVSWALIGALGSLVRPKR